MKKQSRLGKDWNWNEAAPALVGGILILLIYVMFYIIGGSSWNHQ